MVIADRVQIASSARSSLQRLVSDLDLVDHVPIGLPSSLSGAGDRSPPRLFADLNPIILSRISIAQMLRAILLASAIATSCDASASHA